MNGPSVCVCTSRWVEICVDVCVGVVVDVDDTGGVCVHVVDVDVNVGADMVNVDGKSRAGVNVKDVDVGVGADLEGEDVGVDVCMGNGGDDNDVESNDEDEATGLKNAETDGEVDVRVDVVFGHLAAGPKVRSLYRSLMDCQE